MSVFLTLFVWLHNAVFYNNVGENMPSDYNVVIHRREHFGDNPGALPGAFVGKSKTYKFDCPGINPKETAVFTFRCLDVNVSKPKVLMNGKTFDVGIRISGDNEWFTDQLLIGSGLKETGNELFSTVAHLRTMHENRMAYLYTHREHT